MESVSILKKLVCVTYLSSYHLQNSLASLAKVATSCSLPDIVPWSAAKIGWEGNHKGTSLSKWDATELVSNSDSPELLDSESVTDSDGEGNCASPKKVGGDWACHMWRETWQLIGRGRRLRNGKAPPQNGKK